MTRAPRTVHRRAQLSRARQSACDRGLGSLLTMTLSASATPLCDAFEVALFDLDGVVYRGDRPVEHAIEVLETMSQTTRYAFITNNASRRPESIAHQLQDLGVRHAEPDAVITSAQAVAHLIADDIGDGGVVLTIGGDGLRTALTERGLRVVESLADGPDAVVQGFDRGVGWPHLAEAAYAVADGVPWYASNTDSSFPTDRGLAPGNGSLVRAVTMATGKEPVIAGKPYRALFDEALQRCDAREALIVGDRLDTDIRGARHANLPSLAVTTGVSDVNALVATRDRPDYIGPDLRCILEPHPPVEYDSTEARCGRATSHVVDQRIRVNGGSVLERYRSAIGLAWKIIDRTGAVPHIDETLEI